MSGPVTFQVDPTPPRKGRGLWLALGGLVVAAVIGLLAGAVWGLSSRGSGTATGPVVGPTPSPSSTGPSPSPTGPTPTPSPTGPSPSPSGSFPPAPASNQQSSAGWHVGPWRITNTGGVIGMRATVTNQREKTRSGTLTVYLYVDGEPLAAVTTQVADVPGGGAVPATFTSTDAWGPGDKTLLLVAS